jgi:hypothetical protein
MFLQKIFLQHLRKGNTLALLNIIFLDRIYKIFRIKIIVAVHGLKLEIGNWEEQYKSMKAKFLIS